LLKVNIDALEQKSSNFLENKAIQLLIVKKDY